MSENVTRLSIKEPSPLLVGPFQYWQVVVDGRCIPRLTGRKTGDGKIDLVVDHRFAGGPFSEGEAYQAARLIGEAMAIAAGYSNMAADTPGKPFAPQMMQIDLPDNTSQAKEHPP